MSKNKYFMRIIAIPFGMLITQFSFAATSNNQLRVDVGAEVPSLDPQLADDWVAYRVVNDLFAGLVDFDQSNRPIPGMAQSWDISPDGKTYVFHLRDGLKFSDGSSITASDFVYSWQRLVNPATGSSYTFLLKDVVNADAITSGKLPATKLGVFAPNDKTFVVNLTNPSNAFLSYITTPNAFVVSKNAIEKYGKNWIEPKNMVTSGAYTLKEHVVNGYVLAQKNSNYYDAKNVNINEVKYFPFTDRNSAIANYKTGALDITGQTVPVDQFAILKQQYKSQLYVAPWERIDILYFNMKSSKYANNLKLRKALSMAIDREILVNKVLGSGQKALYSPVTPTIENGKYANVKYSWSKLKDKERIAMAKKLYKEAGYGPNNPLTITLKYKNNDLYKKMSMAVAAMLKDTLGVKVDLQNQEWKTLLQSLNKADYDMSQGGWGADYNSVTTYTPLYRCGSSNNRSHYCNTAYDSLIVKAEQTTDPKEQTKLYTKALQIIQDDYVIIPLFEPSHQRLVNSRVKGYQIQNNYLDNVQSKWMKLQDQK